MKSVFVSQSVLVSVRLYCVYSVICLSVLCLFVTDNGSLWSETNKLNLCLAELLVESGKETFH